MMHIIKKFPEQIREAIEIGEKIDMELGEIKNIIVSGMGGSAISGEILYHFSRVPFIVNRDYTIPHFASSSTLFIAISYSGNTEETLKSYEMAKKRGYQTLIITSGGELGKEKNSVIIPGGMQPRAAIAYLLFPLAVFLEKHGLIKDINYRDAIAMAELMRNRMEIAKEIAEEIEGIPIIYGYGVLSTVAKRWRHQLNENSKMFAMNFPMTECNHNEIEAWEKSPPSKFTCIFLRNRKERENVQKRYEFMKEIYGKKAKIIEIYGEGKNGFSSAIYLIYFGDIMSVYRAKINEVEAEPVNLILELKRKLKNQHSRSSSQSPFP